MFRAIVEALMIFAAISLMGEMVREMLISVPSLRLRIVSKWSIRLPCFTAVKYLVPHQYDRLEPAEKRVDQSFPPPDSQKSVLLRHSNSQ